MTSPAFEQLRQRADYTHKYNLDSGRHGWLRLTPAYSVRIVEELIGNTSDRFRVLDPFCGTATTALSAAYHGHSAVTTDINPFLVWFGRVKTAHYPPAVIADARTAATQVIDLVAARQLPAYSPPPIHNIERWWTAPALAFLCRLQAAIDAIAPNESAVTDLLRVAFCRTLMACSNAAFNHQSMSFKDNPPPELDLQPDYASLFRNHITFVLAGAEENPAGTAQILLHDARALSKLDLPPFNLVVTSPPYANRMSYIRELRPYMYWLRFLTNGRDAGELDWLAIGGTWGIATSRLNDWQPVSTAYTSGDLEKILNRMANPCNKNGALLATYIRKYCTDMAQHFTQLRTILAPGASLHYIVGNSTFYGELLSVEKIYAHLMQAAGFTNIQVHPIRKRNSNKALVEFDVSASYD